MESWYLSNSLYSPDIMLNFHLFYTTFNIDFIISTIKFMNSIAQDLIFRLDIQKKWLRMWGLSCCKVNSQYHGNVLHYSCNLI